VATLNDNTRDAPMHRDRTGGDALKAVLSIGGVLAAIGASSCCVLPFALFTVGVSGAWIADLTALEPYQPIFVVLALACLGGGFFVMRRKSKLACADGSYCVEPRSDRIARIGLWTAAALVMVALVLPRAAALFIGS
jgi:mercuric ion transport protein